MHTQASNIESARARIDRILASRQADAQLTATPAPNTDLVPFDFNGSQVRLATDEDGAPWFVAADVAAVLDLADVRTSLRTVDDEDKGRHSVPTLGGQQEVVTINESGLYSLILRSRKAQAKAFKRWVTAEVLPSIRKTGTYAVAAPAAPDLTTASGVLAMAEQFTATARALVAAEQRAVEAETVVAELAPVAEVAVRIMEATGDYSLADAAKMLHTQHGINVGRNRLLGDLRRIGWVDSSGKPYQRRINSGHLGVKVGVWTHEPTGEQRLSSTTRVTGKGLIALAQALREPGTDLAAA